MKNVKKIGYDIRAYFFEQSESNLSFYKKLSGQKIKKICEIPCGNGINKDICKIFEHVYFYDINQKMIKNFQEHNYYKNCKISVASLFDIPDDDFEVINIPRHAIQMFSKSEIKRILASFSKLSKCKKIILNLFNFKYKYNEYYNKTVYVKNIKTNDRYCRKTKVFKKDCNSFLVVHNYYDLGLNKIIFTSKIIMYHYDETLFTNICDDNYLKFRKLADFSTDYESFYIIESL